MDRRAHEKAVTRILLAMAAAGVLSAAAPDPFVAEYCATCHSATRKAGRLSLAAFDGTDAEVSEKVIRKLRSGMMPPLGVPRPDAAAAKEFLDTLEATIDRAAAGSPSAGWRPFQRLTRAEYARAVRDLTGVETGEGAFLPPDTLSGGFDNIADVQSFSPVLMTGYLRGASQISRLATGKKIFVCRPARASEEEACAARIVANLTTQAYRGTAAAEDVRDAMDFYHRGHKSGGFDDGVRFALQSILVSPRFLFRLEPAPTPGTQPIGDLALASRLSAFLWGSGPDTALLDSAKQGVLHTQAGIEAQVRRMLADPRSEALATRFARQWLRLQSLSKSSEPAQSMLRETELFFDSLVREDRNAMDLLTADYSFLNERLAKHYGVTGVTGAAFRRVPMPEERRGLLGQGSVLLSTSLPDRTSPTLRGKWLMEVLLGTPPPPPPPMVPALDDSVKAVRGDVRLSTRQRIDEHAKKPACSGCHRFIDPLGIALENFDAAGVWRLTDNGEPVNPAAELYDGTKIAGLSGLRQLLSAREDQVLRNFTENLLTYATGRRLDYRDMPAVRAIVRNAAGSNNRISAFVLGVVNTPAFQMTEPRSAP